MPAISLKVTIILTGLVRKPILIPNFSFTICLKINLYFINYKTVLLVAYILKYNVIIHIVIECSLLTINI